MFNINKIPGYIYLRYKFLFDFVSFPFKVG